MISNERLVSIYRAFGSMCQLLLSPTQIEKVGDIRGSSANQGIPCRWVERLACNLAWRVVSKCLLFGYYRALHGHVYSRTQHLARLVWVRWALDFLKSGRMKRLRFIMGMRLSLACNGLLEGLIFCWWSKGSHYSPWWRVSQLEKPIWCQRCRLAWYFWSWTSLDWRSHLISGQIKQH